MDRPETSPTSASAGHPMGHLIARIDVAGRLKQFDGLEACRHQDAVIVGAGYIESAREPEKCAASYRQFVAHGAPRGCNSCSEASLQAATERR